MRRNLDKLPKTHRDGAESHPSPACKTGTGEALEYRASSCIRNIGIRLEQCLIHFPPATNLEMRLSAWAPLVCLDPEATSTRWNRLRRSVAPLPRRSWKFWSSTTTSVMEERHGADEPINGLRD
jgi:hypothetical protein